MKRKASTMEEVVLRLRQEDVDVLLDSLVIRESNWRFGATTLDGCSDEEAAVGGVCTQRYEADAVADFYRNRIDDIKMQLSELGIVWKKWGVYEGAVQARVAGREHMGIWETPAQGVFKRPGDMSGHTEPPSVREKAMVVVSPPSENVRKKSSRNPKRS